MVLTHSLEVEEYQKFLNIMRDFRDKRIDRVECVEKVKMLLKGKPDLFLRVQDFLPKSLDTKDCCTYDKMSDYWDALNFICKIKSSSDNDHNYSCFLEILNMYLTYGMPINEVYQEVMILFQDHDDLLEEFNCFLFNCSKGVSFSHESSRGLIKRTSTDDSGGKKMLQLKRYTHLQDVEHIERMKQIQRSDEISKGYPLSNMCIQQETNLNSSTLHSDEEAHIPIMEKDTLMEMWGKISGSVSIKGKCLGSVDPLSKDADVYGDNRSLEEEKCQPIRENFLNCQRYDISYCFLPNNYPVPGASYMSELDASVLNDRLVSVPSENENCTSKFMYRNKYEKCLFRCDDERFEMDIMLCKVASTAQKVEDLLEKVHHSKIELGTTFQIKNYLTDQDFRCIEQLYGDNGLEFVGLLCANASTVLPAISARLKQKQEEVSRKRAELNKVWSEACAKCYPRSLDHRSFQFKQQDRRNLASSVLLDECRQVNERMEDNMLLESVTGIGDISPTMVFEYADREIHDVLHKIMEFYCGKYCSSKEEMDNVMRIWTTFLEPIFGVLTCLKDTESSKAKKHKSRSSVSTSAHIDVSLGAKGFVTHLNYSHTSNASVFLTPIGKKMVNNFETSEQVYEAEGTSEPLSTFFTEISKPLAQHLPKELYEDRGSRIFYGNSSFYLLFRLHQILYVRILSSKMNASSTETRLRTLKKANPPTHYAKFKRTLYSYLNGSTSKSEFEDDCFAFVGPQSYLLSTLDVLLSKLMKQLQEVTSNKIENKFLQLYAYEHSKRLSSDLIYLQNARAIHHGDIFRFKCSANPTKLSIQLIEHPCEESETTTVSKEPNLAAYVHNPFLKSIPERKEMRKPFLNRYHFV